MSALPSENRTRMSSPTRAPARPATRPAARPIRPRSVRAQTGSVGGASEALAAAIDPLAEVRPWGVRGFRAERGGRGLVDDLAGYEEGKLGAGVDMPLSDMVDRASAQLGILRRTLDDAASVGRQTRQASGEIGERLEQGERLKAEIDQRLRATGAASTVIEKASTTLRALEALVGQIRSASGAIEQRLSARMEEQAAVFEARIAEMGARLDERLSEIGRSADEGVRGAEKRVRADADRLGAEVDRRTAQVQARVSVVLDSASDRVGTLERQAEHIGGAITERVERMCRDAVRVLGMDPRKRGAATPAEGSLEDRLMATREVVRDAEDASIRLATLIGGTEEATARVREAGEEAGEALAGIMPLREEAVAQVEHALSRVRDLEGALASAGERHAAAVAEMADANARLATLRDDLSTMASAVGYHTTQAREAQGGLVEACERADGRVRAIDEGLAHVAAQAAGLVALARDAAAMVMQAKAGAGAGQTSDGTVEGGECHSCH